MLSLGTGTGWKEENDLECRMVESGAGPGRCKYYLVLLIIAEIQSAPATCLRDTPRDRVANCSVSRDSASQRCSLSRVSGSGSVEQLCDIRGTWVVKYFSDKLQIFL